MLSGVYAGVVLFGRALHLSWICFLFSFPRVANTPWLNAIVLQYGGSKPRKPLANIQNNVDSGLINPWLINKGVSPFSGDSEGTPP